MEYIVLEYFKDSITNVIYYKNHYYNHVDVTKKRLNELSTDKNAMGRPLIRKVKEVEEE